MVGSGDSASSLFFGDYSRTRFSYATYLPPNLKSSSFRSIEDFTSSLAVHYIFPKNLAINYDKRKKTI